MKTSVCFFHDRTYHEHFFLLLYNPPKGAPTRAHTKPTNQNHRRNSDCLVISFIRHTKHKQRQHTSNGNHKAKFIESSLTFFLPEAAIIKAKFIKSSLNFFLPEALAQECPYQVHLEHTWIFLKGSNPLTKLQFQWNKNQVNWKERMDLRSTLLIPGPTSWSNWTKSTTCKGPAARQT